MRTISEEEAINLRMAPLTTPYSLPKEGEMMDNVVADMEAGSIAYALVEFASGVEVWRKGIKRVD